MRFRFYATVGDSQFDTLVGAYETAVDTDTNVHAAVGDLMEVLYSQGNVDLLNRPQVPASSLEEAGWTDVGEGTATVFSMMYSLGSDGVSFPQDIVLHVTPIRANGTVLSESQLNDYIDYLAANATTMDSVLEADEIANGGSGLLLCAHLVTSGWDSAYDLGEIIDNDLHNLQAIYYLDDRTEIPIRTNLKTIAETLNQEMLRKSSVMFYDSESGSQEMSIAQPNLKLELSKAGTLEFTILPNNPVYGLFTKMSTYVRVMQDDYELFRGRVLEIDDSTWMERHIQCEGDLAYLIDSLQPPQQTISPNTTSTVTKSNSEYRSQYGNHVPARSSTIEKIELGEETNTVTFLETQFRRYITQHNSMLEVDKNFTVGLVTMEDIGVTSFSSTNYRDTKSAIDNDLIKQYGGYLQTRYNPNGPTYIDWLNQPSSLSTQPIVLGINMIDLQKKSEGDELFTILVPIGDSDLTIASVNGGNIGLEDAEGIAKYGKIYKTQSFSGIKKAAELKKLGENYMIANCKPEKLSLTIKAVDMNLIDGEINAIHVGSMVTVVSEPHDIYLTMACTSIEYDIQNPENNSYEIGDPNETMSQKSEADRALAISSASAANRKGSSASSAASSLQDTVNRHAENIIDHADTLYKLEADLVQVHAKCIEITATEKVTVKCDTLDVNASGEIKIKSGGKISMSSNTQINLNDTVLIGDSVGDYNLYAIGESWLQTLTVGGWIYGSLWTEDDGKVNGSQITGFSTIQSEDFKLGDDVATGASLKGAVNSFGAGSVDSAGVVTIPYFSFNSSTTKAGDITFNMAATQFFIDSMAAEYNRGKADGHSSSSDIRIRNPNWSQTDPGGENLGGISDLIAQHSGGYIVFYAQILDYTPSKKYKIAL